MVTVIDQDGRATLIYLQGRRYVVGNSLTTKRRRKRPWKFADVLDTRRVFREPLVTFLVCVARR